MLIFWLLVTKPAITSKTPSKYSVCRVSCNLKEQKPLVLLNGILMHVNYMLGLC